MLSVTAALRFDLAITIPFSNRLAIALAYLSRVVAGIYCIVVFCVMALLSFFGVRPISDHWSWIFLIPLAVYALSNYSTFNFLATRSGDFKAISMTRLYQAVISGFSQVVFGVIGLGGFGLLLGAVLGNSVGAGTLKRAANYDFFLKNNYVGFFGLKKIFIRFKRYPIYSAPEALLNSAMDYLPIVLISTFVGLEEVGYLMLAMRLMQAPIGLVGSAVSRYYLSSAPSFYRDGKLKKHTIKTFLGLLFLSIFVILFGVLACNYASFFWGVGWLAVSKYIAWTIPWFTCQFLVSPLSGALYVLRKEKLAFYLQLVGFLLRVTVVLYANYAVGNRVIELYAASGFVFYVLYLLVVFKSISTGDSGK